MNSITHKSDRQKGMSRNQTDSIQNWDNIGATSTMLIRCCTNVGQSGNENGLIWNAIWLVTGRLTALPTHRQKIWLSHHLFSVSHGWLIACRNWLTHRHSDILVKSPPVFWSSQLYFCSIYIYCNQKFIKSCIIL